MDYKVFISYVEEDSEIAQGLQNSLKQILGVKAFRYENAVLAGQLASEPLFIPPGGETLLLDADSGRLAAREVGQGPDGEVDDQDDRAGANDEVPGGQMDPLPDRARSRDFVAGQFH